MACASDMRSMAYRRAQNGNRNIDALSRQLTGVSIRVLAACLLAISISVSSIATAEPAKAAAAAVPILADQSPLGNAADVPKLPARPLLLSSEMLAALAATAGENVCFAYSYDRNGNRTALNAVTYSGAGTWGSSAYGCFTWSQP